MRTNYRATAKEVDITTIGRPIKLASCNGGAGTLKPGGGLIFMSFSGSFADSGDSLSTAFAWSTIEVLQSFYGDGVYGSGYRFQPIYAYAMSICDANWVDLTAGATLPNITPINYATSGSVWFISANKISILGGSTSVIAATDARLLVLGFIVSAP